MNDTILNRAPIVTPKIRLQPFLSPQTLMVQGTTSDAGKSVLVTALCRILARNNIQVAPFKPQNMALNSAVTIDGGEIGRAQAVQADACYLRATTTMNPVLLKPNSDLGAQVIVNGKAIGNMQAKDYHHFKPALLKTVVAAHQQLQHIYQVVVVEGAGSPAEINLRAHDIANMGFAEAIDCPVIIVADIDRGGVFAHLYGTYALLSETEKQRIKGFVINRFRGDASLLDTGLTWLEEKTGVPTLAVIPYITDLHIEAEDSLSTAQYSQSNYQHDLQHCRVAVPMYPRASNHTDFDALRMHPQIECTFYTSSESFTGADIIILPGSKHVRGDLQWLKDTGWCECITRHRRLGGKVIGICGGYQMLGHWIHDPDGVESSAGSSAGLGLLAMETTLEAHKVLRNVHGHFALNPLMSNAVSDNKDIEHKKIHVKGYEVHTGSSRGPALDNALLQLQHTDDITAPLLRDGACSLEGDVMGTYVHGFFDQHDVVEYCLQWAGINMSEPFNYTDYKEAQIDRLSDEVERALSLESILALFGIDKNTLNTQVSNHDGL